MNKRQKKKAYRRRLNEFFASHIVKYTGKYFRVRKEDITPQIPKMPEPLYFPVDPRYLVIDGKEVTLHDTLCQEGTLEVRD